MAESVMFEKAFPFQDDLLALPVKDIDEAARWYGISFSMSEISRYDSPFKTVIMARDNIQLGFTENGKDSSQDGAAILVKNIAAARNELHANDVATGEWRIDERDGNKYQVFFVVAPDGLCYYFHEPLGEQ